EGVAVVSVVDHAARAAAGRAFGALRTLRAGVAVDAVGATQRIEPLAFGAAVTVLHRDLVGTVAAFALDAAGVADARVEVADRRVDRAEGAAHVVVVAALDHVHRRGEHATGVAGTTTERGGQWMQLRQVHRVGVLRAGGHVHDLVHALVGTDRDRVLAVGDGAE